MRFFYLLLLAALCGCSGYQYVASPQYVPLNTRKGDLKANIFFNHAQLGYSVGNHISVFATGYRRDGGTFINTEAWGKENSGANNYDDYSYEVNGGASYFTTRNRFVYELHLGTGGGKIDYAHNRDEFNNYSFKMRADKANVFLQPSFSYLLMPGSDQFVEIGFFARVMASRYHNMRATAIFGSESPDGLKEDNYFLNRDQRTLYFAEPGVVFRAGGRWIKGSLLTSLTNSLQPDHVRSRPFNLYASLFVNLHLLRKNKP